MHINGTLLDIDVSAPDLVQQLTAGVCALLVGHEELQQAVLGGADLRRSAVDGYPMADRIQAQTTDLDRCFIVQGAGTAQHGLQAGDQLPGGEGLGNVVISADFQSLDLVILLALGGEHDDGDVAGQLVTFQDRKSTRLNSSHVRISYAVFWLKKKKNTPQSNALY